MDTHKIDGEADKIGRVKNVRSLEESGMAAVLKIPD